MTKKERHQTLRSSHIIGVHTEIEFSSEVSAGCDRRFGPKNKGAGDSDAVLTPEGNRRSPDASSGEENCGESAEHRRELS